MPVRSGGATDPASRLEELLAIHDRKFRSAFLLAIQVVRDQGTLEELAELLAAGRLEEALGGLQAAAEALGGQYGASLSAAGEEAAKFLSENALTVSVRFDVSNTRAVEMIRRERFRLIQGFTNEQRTVVQRALMDGTARGLNPREQARLFRDSIGLTEKQQRAVENYRRLLTAGRDGRPSSEVLDRALRDGRFDRRVRRAIQDGELLSDDQIERMVGRYRERMVKYRSEVIGRTEALRAVHQGTEEMYQQAIDAGQIDPEQLSRKWVAARDERVRGSHRRLNGLVRRLGETWPGDDGPLKFPGDPSAPASETVQCRCVLSTRLRP